jgi:hypothetical protein
LNRLLVLKGLALAPEGMTTRVGSTAESFNKLPANELRKLSIAARCQWRECERLGNLQDLSISPF